MSNNIVLRGLDYASRQKNKFSYENFSEAEHRDSEIDFGSSMNFVGCAGGSGVRKKSSASSTVTSGSAQSSSSAGGSFASASSSASGGSGQGSNGGEDGDGRDHKKLPDDKSEHSETDTAEGDDEDDLEDPDFQPAQSAVISSAERRSGTSLLRRNVAQNDVFQTSRSRRAAEIRERRNAMDNRVRMAGAGSDDEEVAAGQVQAAGRAQAAG